MTSLFVDRRDVHLQLDGGALVFRENGQRIGAVPLAPITRVFLRGNVTLEASLLGKLGEGGDGNINENGNPASPGAADAISSLDGTDEPGAPSAPSNRKPWTLI